MTKKTRPRADPALVGVIVSAVTLAAGPALGARINKCTTITRPGIYVLTRNITANGDCFVVRASGVVLDLGGRVVTGDHDEDTTGIRGGSGVTVRNGTINRFGIGVDLGAHANVDSVHGGGHQFTGASVGDHSVISASTIGGSAFNLRAGALSVVTFNAVSNNDEIPITVGPGSVVSDNTVNSGFFAIVAGAGSIVERNTVRVFDGAIGISAALGSIVRSNTIEGEGGDVGIAVQCPAIVAGNTFTNLATNVEQRGEGCTVIDNLAP